MGSFCSQRELDRALHYTQFHGHLWICDDDDDNDDDNCILARWRWKRSHDNGDARSSVCVQHVDMAR